jgi:hypothetical protein
VKPDACASPVGLPALIAWWLGELDEAEDARIGEHLVGCGHCTAEGQWLADLASGLRVLVGQGAIQAAVSRAFVDRATASGMKLREYRVLPETSVNCTLAPDDDLLVTSLVAPLGGVERLDVLMLYPDGGPSQRLEDVPFDAAAGEVLFTSRTADIRALPKVSFRMQLLATGPQGERVLGTYGFHHTPWEG